MEYLILFHLFIITFTFFQTYCIFHNISILFFTMINLLVLIYSKIKYNQFSITSKERLKEFITTYILSIIFSFSLLRILIIEDYFHIQIYIYLMSLSVYHFSEYAFVCVFHFEKLNFNSKFNE